MFESPAKKGNENKNENHKKLIYADKEVSINSINSISHDNHIKESILIRNKENYSIVEKLFRQSA
jgi:hypothetical protein